MREKNQIDVRAVFILLQCFAILCLLICFLFRSYWVDGAPLSACQPRKLAFTAACQVRISTQITPTRLTGDIRPKILCYDLMERKKKKNGACGSIFFLQQLVIAFEFCDAAQPAVIGFVSALRSRKVGWVCAPAICCPGQPSY